MSEKTLGELGFKSGGEVHVKVEERGEEEWSEIYPDDIQLRVYRISKEEVVNGGFETYEKLRKEGTGIWSGKHNTSPITKDDEEVKSYSFRKNTLVRELKKVVEEGQGVGEIFR